MGEEISGEGAYGIPQVFPSSNDAVEYESLVAPPPGTFKCLQCLGEWTEAKRKRMPLPVVNDAITLAPSWLSQSIPGMGMAMACVAVPACLTHLETREETAEERAVKGGLIIGG